MKLYFSRGACSLAPHIVLREAGYTFDLEQVDLAKKRTASGDDYLKTNPKGYVPALALDDGSILTEASLILQYLADQRPQTGLVPEAGSMERYRMMEWLNFIATDIHKQFNPLWKPNTPDAMKSILVETLGKGFDYITSQLGNKPFLTGDRFTIADAYLYVLLRWSAPLKLDLSKWPKLKAYIGRVADRSSVSAALKAEGLAK
jgi:glutathione S-transferase